MSDFVEKPIKKKLNRNNPASRIERVERRTGPQPSSTIRSLDELSPDLGDIVAGRFITPTTEVVEPSSTDFTGSFMSADGETFDGNIYNVGAVRDGQIQVGFNTNGDLVAGAGTVLANSDGITIEAPELPDTAVVKWVDPSDVTVASLLGGYVPALASGIYTIGRARDVSSFGLVGMQALLSTQTPDSSAYTTKAELNTKGQLTVDLRDGTDTNTGSKAVDIQSGYEVSNALQNLLYLDLYTTGTAAAGLGPAIAFRGENGSGTITALAYLAAKYVTVTNGAEEAKPVLGLTMGGTQYDHGLSLIKYAKGSPVTIGTSETTLFDVAVPANWLTGDNQIQWKLIAKFIATTSRIITWRIYYDDTLMISNTTATGTNTTTTYEENGVFVSTGSNTQMAQYKLLRLNNTAGGVGEILDVVQGTASEDTSTVKNVKVTCQLAGAVTSATAAAIVVEFLPSIT